MKYLVTIAIVFATQVALAQAPKSHVLIIGIDGCRPDALEIAKTPNLDLLIKEGAYSNETQILGERYQKNNTISGPGWSSFLTGVWADKHGVHDNSFKGKNYEQYPHFFKRLKQQFPDAKTATFVDWKPIDDHIVSDADIRIVYDAHGADGYTKEDAKLTDAAVKCLSEDDPHAVMVYLGQVDETGHRYGFHPKVPEYIKAIERVDEHIGKLIMTMKSRKNFKDENWRVVMSTDHGGQGLGHGGGHKIPEIRTTFFIVSPTAKSFDIKKQQTYVVDVAVTALVHLGVKIQLEWKLDGKAVGVK